MSAIDYSYFTERQTVYIEEPVTHVTGRTVTDKYCGALL